MCTIVEERGDEGRTWETIGELREIWPEPVWLQPSAPSNDDNCLCGVAIEATARKYGWKTEYSGWGYYVDRPAVQAKGGGA